MIIHRDHRISRPALAAAYAVVVLLALAPSLQAAEAAEDPPAAELTQPKSTIEAGTGYVSRGSYKFGEYNGLQKQGALTLGNMELFGGGSYDSDSVTRWGLHANDLGLRTGDASFSFREQGKFRLDFVYDDFRRNYSDTYQSPYLGLGSSNLTLPAGWLRPVVPQVNPNALNYRALSPTAGQGSAVSPTGAVVAPTAVQLEKLAAIVSADATSVRNFDLQTERKRGEVGFGVNLNPFLQLTGGIRHEVKNGFKPLGAVTSAVQENSVTIPDLIDTSTDQLNLGLEYTRPKGFLQAGYYGSIFRNNVDAMSWQDPNDPTRTATISSAPSNQFHQLNLAGGYNLFSTTKVVADLSYGRGSQNESFLADRSLPLGLPAYSANGLVVTKVANVKLSMRPTRKLGLAAHYKYDDRDNQTPINTFTFYDANMARAAAASPFNAALGLAPNTLGSNIAIFNNRPMSRKLNQFDLGADYALGHGNRLAGGYEWQKIERACFGAWINCASAPESIERTLHVDWRAQLFDSISSSVSYGYAERRVHYDPNAWLALVPMANVIPGAPIVGATTSVYGYLTQTGLTGFGPLAGFPTVPLTGNAAIFSPNNNIVPQSLYASRDNVTELPGMRSFNLADRERHRVRASIESPASDRASLPSTFEFDRDEYTQSVYGLQRAGIWTLGLDGTYALGERLAASAFFTHENQRSTTAGDGFGSNTNVAFIGRAGDTGVAGSCYTTVKARNNNGKLDPCLNWSADLHDRADTVGFSLAARGLMGRRLDLSGDVIFTRAVTDIGVAGASYSNNPFALAGGPVLPAGNPAVFLIPSANLPAVTTRTFELRLGARYAVSKATDVRLLYAFQRMKAVDFAYDGMQFGTGTEQFPTSERAPNYAVHVFGAYYKHRF
jgi:MtrB/PioB family decaheme-associated outer membrane protein